MTTPSMGEVMVAYDLSLIHICSAFQYAYDGEECEADTAQSCQYTCRYKVGFVYACHFKKEGRQE